MVLNLLSRHYRKILAVVIILATVILGSWFFLNHDRAQNQPLIELGLKDNGKTFQVKKETKVLVKLPENPSTGYEWKIVEGKDSLNLLENKYIPPENQTIGKGGFRRIKFTITSSGRVTMHYARPWENQVEKNFTINFQL